MSIKCRARLAGHWKVEKVKTFSTNFIFTASTASNFDIFSFGKKNKLVNTEREAIQYKQINRNSINERTLTY